MAARAVQAIVSYAAGPAVDSVWLYDWRVHYAGALDLVERDLYLDGGISVGALQMPVHVFNLPPASAVIAAPLLPFGYAGGGALWVAVGTLAMIAAGLGVWRIAGGVVLPAALGVFWVWYALQPFFVRVSVLGNVNSLILALIVAFLWAHLQGHQRTAGALLGAAIAIKAWPLLVGFVLVRERRWRELGWAGIVVAAQGMVIALWLGPGVVPEMVAALRTQVPIPNGVMVVWTSWVRESFGWWPWWGSILLACLLLAVPFRGRLGLALGLLAGLTLVANLWDHYLPTFAVVAALMLSSDQARTLGRTLGNPHRVPDPATARSA